MQRRKFRPEFKLQCVLDILSGRKSPAQICRENNISESVLNNMYYTVKVWIFLI
jgi:transposase-like protein